MSSPILIFDSQFLCYQTHYANKKMPESNNREIFILNFLGRVLYFSRKFRSTNIVFAWDSVLSYRKNEIPGYKQKRKEKLSEEEKKDRSVLYKRIDFLRKKVIPALGFKNSFLQDGLEADDIIADISFRYGKDQEVYIVATDNDLYQLLSENVSMVMPNIKNAHAKIYSREDFKNKYRIEPCDWWKVKSIAGCVSDNVDGIAGIGPVNAIKWILQEIDVNSKKGTLIQNNLDLAKKNEQYVRLPHEKTAPCILQKDEVTFQKFQKVCKKLGVWEIVEADNISGWSLLFGNSKDAIKRRLNK